MCKIVFLNCKKLSVSVDFSSYVGQINDDSLALPDTVTKIGKNAFFNCFGLNDDAFSGFTLLLGTFVIPESVARIENRAFYRCTGFTSLIKFGSSSLILCVQKEIEKTIVTNLVYILKREFYRFI